MGAQSETETGIRFDETYWKFLLLVSDERGNLYLVFPNLLKLTIHPPKHPIYTSWHAHWKDYRLGLHEDVDASCFSEGPLMQNAANLLSSFRLWRPTSNERITVLTDFLDGAVTTSVVKNRERTVLDIGKLMKAFFTGSIYQTKARRLPLLMRELERNDPSVESSVPKLWAFSKDEVIVPLDYETIISFDLRAILSEGNKAGLCNLFEPVGGMMDTIQRESPEVFEKWYPKADIEKFSKETINALSELASKKEISDF